VSRHDPVSEVLEVVRRFGRATAAQLVAETRLPSHTVMAAIGSLLGIGSLVPLYDDPDADPAFKLGPREKRIWMLWLGPEQSAGPFTHMELLRVIRESKGAKQAA
jgi:hypothetical protein